MTAPYVSVSEKTAKQKKNTKNFFIVSFRFISSALLFVRANIDASSQSYDFWLVQRLFIDRRFVDRGFVNRRFIDFYKNIDSSTVNSSTYLFIDCQFIDLFIRRPPNSSTYSSTNPLIRSGTLWNINRNFFCQIRKQFWQFWPRPAAVVQWKNCSTNWGSWAIWPNLT
jgi:hypothetical protein